MYRGAVQISKEYLKLILGLPKEVEITAIDFDFDRAIASIHVASQEPVQGYTYKLVEGQSVVSHYLRNNQNEQIMDMQLRIYERVRDEIIGVVSDEELERSALEMFDDTEEDTRG